MVPGKDGVDEFSAQCNAIGGNMQGVTINVNIGSNKGLLGKPLSEIVSKSTISKKKKKKKEPSLLKQVLESTLPKKAWDVETV